MTMNSIASTLALYLLFASLAIANNNNNTPVGGLDGESENFQNLAHIHGMLMFFAFLCLFPIGAVYIRVNKTRLSYKIHAVIQVTSYIVALIGFGTGIWLVKHTSKDQNLWKAPPGHAIVGTLVIAALSLQLIGGIIHHSIVTKITANTPANARIRIASRQIGIAHSYFGLFAIGVGMINGVWGYDLTQAKIGAMGFYVVSVAVIYGLWNQVVGKAEQEEREVLAAALARRRGQNVALQTFRIDVA